MAMRNVIRKSAQEKGKTEEQLLVDALEQCGHEQTEVARLLGVSQSAVSAAMKRLGFRLVKRYITQGDLL